MQLKYVREDYQKFGEAAGIDAETMKNITDHVSTSEEGMVEVCDLWMQKCWQKNVTPSWSGVAEILTRIGRKDWAKKIVKVYTTGTCGSHNVDTGASALAGLLLEAPVWRVLWRIANTGLSDVVEGLLIQ